MSSFDSLSDMAGVETAETTGEGNPGGWQEVEVEKSLPSRHVRFVYPDDKQVESSQPVVEDPGNQEGMKQHQEGIHPQWDESSDVVVEGPMANDSVRDTMDADQPDPRELWDIPSAGLN